LRASGRICPAAAIHHCGPATIVVCAQTVAPASGALAWLPTQLRAPPPPLGPVHLSGRSARTWPGARTGRGSSRWDIAREQFVRHMWSAAAAAAHFGRKSRPLAADRKLRPTASKLAA